MITAGNYKFMLWGYSEFYEDPANSNTVTPFIPNDMAFFIPNDLDLRMVFAGVPTLIDVNQGGITRAIGRRSGYVMDNYVDERNTSHTFTLSSAGLIVPVSIDKMYTLNAL
jgi:hypothetical protein